MTALRVRSDALPEGTTYRIDSCAPRGGCSDPFSCPFDLCVEDLHGPSRIRQAESLARDQRVHDMRAAGCSIKEIAMAVGLHRRQVFRLLARQIPSVSV